MSVCPVLDGVRQLRGARPVLRGATNRQVRVGVQGVKLHKLVWHAVAAAPKPSAPRADRAPGAR